MKEDIIRKELERRAESLRRYLDATHALGRFVGDEAYSLARAGRTVRVSYCGQSASVVFSRSHLGRFPFHGDSRDLDIGVGHGLSLFHELVGQIIEIDQETERAKKNTSATQQRREQELDQAIPSTVSAEPEHNL